MKTRFGLFFIVLLILYTPIAQASEDYNHIYSLEAPNPENSAWYGYQVEINEEYIVVSEPYGDTEEYSVAGKIYVYNHDGVLVSTLISPTAENGDTFGYKMDLSGNKILSGEYSDTNDLKNAGRAHLFDVNGSHVYSFEAEEPTAGAYFGTRASLDPDIMVISETGAKTNVTCGGKVHLYDPQGNYLKYLESPSPRVLGRFGATVKVGEGLILVGEYGNAGQTPIGSGSVYVFDYSGIHLFTLQASEPENQAIFGKSITVSEELIIVGEPWATVDNKPKAGRAYIYNISGDLMLTLESPTPKSYGEYASSVAVYNDIIVAGEWDAHVNPGQYEGRAYVYDNKGNLLQNLTSPNPCPRAAFGLDVDICGDLIVVGECWAAAGELGQAGRVQVYKLGAPAPVETQDTSEDTTTESEEPESDNEQDGGIPGYSLLSILAALVVYYMLREWMN